MADTSAFDPKTKLLLHPKHLAAFVDGDWKKYPIGVEVSPTNSCNAKCPWCFYVSSEYKQRHSAEELRYELLDDLIWSLSVGGVESLTWTGGGEPSTYSHIDEAIDRVHRSGLLQGMFTNAYVKIAEPEKLEWIRITVTEKFLLTKHVRAYVDSGTDVGVNFNVTNDNQGQLRKLFDEALMMGVKYFQFRPALADTYDKQEVVEYPKWIDNDRYDELGVKVERTGYKWTDYTRPHGYDVCLGHHIVPFVWHDGDVSVCAYHKRNPDYTFGNLGQETFDRIWTGQRRRNMIARGIAVIKSCQHCCKLHESNKVLSTLLGVLPRPAHPEFV